MSDRHTIMFYYFSRGGNTEKFAFKTAEFLSKHHHAIVNKINSVDMSPHKPFVSIEKVFDESAPGFFPLEHKFEKISKVFFVPTYGVYDHDIHETKDYTPQAIIEAVELFGSMPEIPTAFVSFGNRTFGHHFCKVSEEISHLPKLGEYELAGTKWEAKELAEKICDWVRHAKR